jgi:3-phenylpropionate/trans-cinnamate dioxygenase ferredoxin component
MRHPVARISEIAQGTSKLVKVNDEKVLIFHLSDGVYATEGRCTHLFRSMEKGKIVEDKCVQCPLHRARFDIRTGEVVEWANFPPGVQLLNAVRKEKALRTWPVEVEGDQIFVIA